MVFACGHCGAPLELEEGRAVIECTFCKKKNRVADLEAAAARVVADAPATPASVSAPKPMGRYVLGGLLVVPLAIGGIAYAVHMQGSTVEDVAQLPLESSPDEIDKKLDVTWRTDDSVRVTFRSGASGPYEHVVYHWDNKDFSLPDWLGLLVAEGSKLDPKVLAALKKSLPGLEEGSWHWGPASLQVDLESGAIHVSVKSELDRGKPNLLRKRQLTALWQIARSAAFGGPDVAREEKVAVLGAGYPLPRLAAFDPAMRFEEARRAVPPLFPGTLEDGSSAFDVAVDHPHLRHVTLTWENAAEGRLTGVHFRVASSFRAQLTPFIACLTKELGPPEVRVSDFSKGTTSTTFHVRDEATSATLDMHVGDEANLYFVASRTFEAGTWKRAFEAVDRCR